MILSWSKISENTQSRAVSHHTSRRNQNRAGRCSSGGKRYDSPTAAPLPYATPASMNKCSAVHRRAVRV